MSLLNCYIAADHALVAVDTHVQGPDGAVEASKLLPLPHANVVLAMRGELLFFSWAASALHMSLAHGFDEMAEAVSEVLAQVYARRQTIAEQHPFAGIELAVVGWSKALGRMQGVRYERWPDDTGFRVTPVVPWSLSPNPGYMPEAPDNAERMEAIARDQVALLKSLPMVCAGGRLLLAELTRDALSVRTIADLEQL